MYNRPTPSIVTAVWCKVDPVTVAQCSVLSPPQYLNKSKSNQLEPGTWSLAGRDEHYRGRKWEVRLMNILVISHITI